MHHSLNYLLIHQKKQMNKVIVIVGKVCSHQAYRNIPQVSFPHGINSLAKVQGEVMPGILLLLVLFLLTNEGDCIFRSLFSRKEHKKYKDNIAQYLGLFTHLLLLD